MTHHNQGRLRQPYGLHDPRPGNGCQLSLPQAGNLEVDDSEEWAKEAPEDANEDGRDEHENIYVYTLDHLGMNMRSFQSWKKYLISQVTLFWENEPYTAGILTLVATR